MNKNKIIRLREWANSLYKHHKERKLTHYPLRDIQILKLGRDLTQMINCKRIISNRLSEKLRLLIIEAIIFVVTNLAVLL